MKTAEKPCRIGWRTHPEGYEVITYYRDGDISIYEAGNHPQESSTYIPSTDLHAVSPERLEEWAKQTAYETAVECGLPESAVFHDDEE